MKKSIAIFHWLPRIICILAILFISMFACDAFDGGHTLWQQLGAFFMHLIPLFILLIVLIIAWKWEYIGGIIFMIIGMGLSPVVFMMNYNDFYLKGTSWIGEMCHEGVAALKKEQPLYSGLFICPNPLKKEMIQTPKIMVCFLKSWKQPSGNQ